MLRAISIFFLCLAAGCTQFPEVDQATGDAAADLPYPTILPLPEIDAAIADQGLTAEEAEKFRQEVEELKRRGLWLRQQEVQ